MSTTEDASVLTFRQLKREDVGNYTCITTNREGTDSFTASLRIKSEFESIASGSDGLTMMTLQHPRNGSSDQQERFVLQKDLEWVSIAQPEGNQSQWSPSRRDRVRHLLIARPVFILLSCFFLCLFFMADGGWMPFRPLTTNGLFQSVSRSDAGAYRCRADNGEHPAIESEFHLQVSGTEPAMVLAECSICPPKDQSLAFSRNEALSVQKGVPLRGHN